MATYKILRFRFNGETTVQETGLTLEEAQAHCRREDTHGDGWFDGYEQEDEFDVPADWHPTGIINDGVHRQVGARQAGAQT